MRGQVGPEYIFLLSLVFIVAATSILQSFKDVEINLALSSARLACTEMASRNSSLECFVLGYSIGSAPPQVNITPQLASYYSAANKTELKNLILTNMNRIFRPEAATDTSVNWTWAAYYNYSINIQ
ncbi:MAG: hypothetical protein V1708_03570 [Candidatus Micrarchaeota archaeon]